MTKPNKFTEIKENIAMTEKKAEDVKTIFDSIRNIAICAGLTLALPDLINFIESRFNFNNLAVDIFIVFSLSFIFILYTYNIRWLAFKTKEKTSNTIKSKASFFFSNMFFIILITILTAGVTILELVDTVLLKRF